MAITVMNSGGGKYLPVTGGTLEGNLRVEPDTSKILSAFITTTYGESNEATLIADSSRAALRMYGGEAGMVNLDAKDGTSSLEITSDRSIIQLKGKTSNGSTSVLNIRNTGDTRRVYGLTAPTIGSDAANKDYVDGAVFDTEITIPAGRMLGDVNGDGFIDDKDSTLINLSTHQSDAVTDPLAQQCCDINQDGIVNMIDATLARNVGQGNRKYGKQPDLLGVWTVNPNYETEEAQYYTDIGVKGLKGIDESITVYIDNAEDYKIMVRGDIPVEDTVRIYAKRCPIAPIKCLVRVFRSAFNEAVPFQFVYIGKLEDISNDFVVNVTKVEDDYYETDYSSQTIKKMVEQGKNPVLYYDGYKYFLTGIAGTIATFSRIYTSSGARAMIADQFCIQNTIVDYTGFEVIARMDDIKKYFPQKYTSVPVPADSWITSTTYSEYPYQADIEFIGAESSGYAVMRLSDSEIVSGNILSICRPLTDKVRIYAKEKPNKDITISAIVYFGCDLY